MKEYELKYKCAIEIMIIKRTESMDENPFHAQKFGSVRAMLAQMNIKDDGFKPHWRRCR